MHNMVEAILKINRHEPVLAIGFVAKKIGASASTI